MSSLLLAMRFLASFQAQEAPTPNHPPSTIIRHVGGDVLSPVVIASTGPVYPSLYWHKNTDHHVLAHLIVDGLPQDIKVLTRGSRPFDDAAPKAVRTYRSKPSTEFGKPVPVEIDMDVQFKVF